MFWTAAALLVTLASASTSLPGGPIDVDINTPAVQDALNFAVGELNKQSDDLYVSKVAKVIKAQSQVVAGMKYIFTVEMARTSCTKGGVETECEIYTDLTLAKPYTCTFEVWSRPWMGPPVVIKNVCKH